MDIDADLFATGNGIPTQGRYILELCGFRFRGLREQTPADHKIDTTVVTGNGGLTAIGVAPGVLDANGEGSFILLVDSAKRFRTILQARNPIARLTEIPFDIRGYVLDPLTFEKRGEHTTPYAMLTNHGPLKKLGVTGGAELAVCEFAYKALKEIDDGYSTAR